MLSCRSFPRLDAAVFDYFLFHSPPPFCKLFIINLPNHVVHRRVRRLRVPVRRGQPAPVRGASPIQLGAKCSLRFLGDAATTPWVARSRVFIRVAPFGDVANINPRRVTDFW